MLSPPQDYLIDDPEIERLAPILIQDADASQHSALIDIMQGKNLVVQGPPGTGKSQTITNVVANAIAQAKTVLFLAEKQAALDVVKRRLDEAGLGVFCLELHSGKASPREVVESLKTRHKLGYRSPRGAPSPLRSDIAWEESRREIAGYLRALHQESSDGETAFSLIWRALRGRTELGSTIRVPLSCSIELSAFHFDEPEILARIKGDVSLFTRECQKASLRCTDPVMSSRWRSIQYGEKAGLGIAAGLVEDLRRLRESASRVDGFLKEASTLAIDDHRGLDRLAEIDAVLDMDVPEGQLIERISKLQLEHVEKLLSASRR